jgi:biopolymer transport protein ExbD
MRTVAFVLLLAVVVAGGGGGEAPAPKLAPLTLPVASKGVPDKADDPHDRVIIGVDALGRVHTAGKRNTLDGLVTYVMGCKERYDKQTKGQGYEKLPHGGVVSKIYALLRIHKDVPWQQVQWILTLLAEQRIYKVQFAVKRQADRSYTKEEAAALGAKWVDQAPPAKPKLEAKLKAFLPTDKGLLGGWKQPQELTVALHVMARQEIRAEWGPDRVPISKPTVFKYKFADRVCGELAVATGWIGDALRAVRSVKPPVRVVGEIKAGYKVPFKYVVAVLNRFREQGVDHVDFWGTPIAGKEILKLPSLPYPIKNYPTGR